MIRYKNLGVILTEELRVFPKNLYSLKYDYSYLLSSDIGRIKDIVTPEGLLEDLQTIREFYDEGVYQRIKNLSSSTVRGMLMYIDAYYSELDIYLVAKMLSKEVQGFFQRFLGCLSFPTPINRQQYVKYDYESHLKDLKNKIIRYNRFSGEFLEEKEYGCYPDEAPILKPQEFSESYIKKWYTLPKFPEINYIDSCLKEAGGRYTLSDLMDAPEDIAEDILSSPNLYPPDTLKLMMSLRYKTIV